MKLKVLAAIVLVVAALPAATAYAPTAGRTDALDGSNTLEQGTTTATGSSSSTADDSSGDGSADYTKLYVDTDHDYPELKPGETGTFNITVENGENSTVTVNPHLYVPPVSRGDRIEKSWLSIEGDTELAPGEEQTFTVTVTVPEDAEIGYYNGQIAFTDETVTYPGRPARPVHAAGINVRVWRQPTVEIVSGDYLRGQIEAGDSVTRQIVIENTGDQAVPVNPQLKGQNSRIHYGSSRSRIDPSWIDVDAPSSIAPGETATVTVTVSAPDNADNGRYNGEIDLGLKDPARRDDNSYWQEINLNFEVWSQPSEPYHTSFRVSEDAENVSLTLSPSSSYYANRGSDKRTSFDVVFVSPSGERFDADRVRLTDRGMVDLSAQSRGNAVRKQGEYGVRGVGQEFVYRVADPEAGQWTVEIMPHNTMRFSYEIVRNEPLDAATATNATA